MSTEPSTQHQIFSVMTVFFSAIVCIQQHNYIQEIEQTTKLLWHITIVLMVIKVQTCPWGNPICSLQ